MQPSDMTAIEEQYRERMGYEDYSGAWDLIAPLLAGAGEIADPAVLARLLAAFAEIAEENYGPALAEPARAAAAAPTDAEALYRLGYALQGKNLPALSAGPLRRAHALAPADAPILTELVSALERQGRYAEARALLEAAPAATRRPFLPAYLLAFNALMTGDAAAAGALLPALGRPGDPAEAFMVARIRAMLARAAALQAALPAATGTPRGAHYIRYAGLLLCAPEGGALAGGQDTFARLAGALSRLEEAAEAWGLAPAQVLSLPDPASRGLARAFAARRQAPCADWLGAATPGWLIAYDLRGTLRELRELLRSKRPGQPLFAYAAGPAEQDVCPDALGLRYRALTPAWETEPDAEAGIFDTPEPDGADPDAIAAQIEAAAAAALPPPDPDLTAMIAFLASVQEPDTLPLARRPEGQREPLWAQAAP
jgi:hypothetical protein